MQALGRHLANTNPEDDKLVSTCLTTMRNLSDAATKVENMDMVLHLLVQCLEKRDINMVQCAAGTIMNLTCNNMKNKLAVYHHQGIDVLCKLVSNQCKFFINPSVANFITEFFKFLADTGVLEPVLCSLRNLTSRHPEAYNASLAVRNHYGLNKIVEQLTLTNYNNWSLIKPTIVLIRNLAQNAIECQAALRGLGTMPKLMNIISFAKTYFQKSKSSSNSPKEPWHKANNNNNVLPCRIRPEDIAISSCNALNCLAKDDHNRRALISLNAIPILCELLRHHVPQSESEITEKQKLYGKTLKQEAQLAEEVCGSAAHVLLTLRLDEQARQYCQNFRVNETLDQFQRYLSQNRPPSSQAPEPVTSSATSQTSSAPQTPHSIMSTSSQPSTPQKSQASSSQPYPNVQGPYYHPGYYGQPRMPQGYMPGHPPGYMMPMYPQGYYPPQGHQPPPNQQQPPNQQGPGHPGPGYGY